MANIPQVELHFGHFLTHEVTMPDAATWTTGRYRPVRVMKTEEKGSDVNLATHLLMDAFDDLFDVAVIISNDSDLKEPIVQVSNRFGKKIVLLGPRTTRIGGALRPLADFIRQFGPGCATRSAISRPDDRCDRAIPKAGRLVAPDVLRLARRWGQNNP